MKLLTVSILTLIYTLNLKSQDVLMSHNEASHTIYNTKANIRKSPSLISEIVAVSKEGELLDFRYDHIRDIINGISSVWKKVKYKDEYGYVWGPLTSLSASFKSQEFINHSFLISQKTNSDIHIKLSNNNVFKETFLLNNNTGLNFYAAYSLGKTYNSNKNDVFVFYFGDYDYLITKYYQWDGAKITLFNKKLKDNSFAQYNLISGGIITENVVNLRAEPSVNSDIVKALGLGYKINSIKYEQVLDSINGKKGFWNRVTHNNDTGFVWGRFLGYYTFESYKDEELSFILKQGEEDSETILAVKNGQIIDSYSFSRLSNFIGAHSRGSMGLKNISEIIGVCYSGGICGTTSGDVLIVFDGKKFFKSFTEAGVGDGGLYFGENVTFPSDNGGKEGVVSITTYDSESIDLPGENNYESINRSVLIRNYVLKNDSLLEIDSETKKIEKLVKVKFPKYNLGYFKKGDINGDGFEDVVLYARYNINNYEMYDVAKNKSLLAILLNDKKGNYKLQSYTNKLVYHNENDPLTSIKLIDNGFKLNIYYAGYYNEDTNNNQYEVTFKYEKNKNDFFMREIIEYTPTSQQWSKEVFTYKSKSITFKDSYTPEGEY
jgi:hypothetical protein